MTLFALASAGWSLRLLLLASQRSCMYATAERTVFRLMKMHLEQNSLYLTSLHLTLLSSEAAAKITTSLTALCWFQIEDHLSPAFGQPPFIQLVGLRCSWSF